jgi:Domain of unknown function (DUF5658)
MRQRKFLIIALGAFALLSAADFALTRHLLEDTGAAYEANPVANWLLQRHGWSGLAFFKLAIGLLVAGLSGAVYCYRPKAARQLLGFACVALAIVVGYSSALAVVHESRGHLDAEVAQELQEDQRLSKAQENVAEYRSVLEQVTTRLEAGTMTLAEAVDEINTTDKANDPDWLSALHYLYPGLTDRGCLSASLIQNTLASVDLSTPSGKRASRRLVSELYALCGTDSPTSFHPILQRFDLAEVAPN